MYLYWATSPSLKDVTVHCDMGMLAFANILDRSVPPLKMNALQDDALGHSLTLCCPKSSGNQRQQLQMAVLEQQHLGPFPDLLIWNL